MLKVGYDVNFGKDWSAFVHEEKNVKRRAWYEENMIAIEEIEAKSEKERTAGRREEDVGRKRRKRKQAEGL